MYLNYLILGLLFFVLQPGVLLTIPMGKEKNSTIAALVHALVFVLIVWLLQNYLNLNLMSIEEFKKKTKKKGFIPSVLGL